MKLFQPARHLFPAPRPALLISLLVLFCLLVPSAALGQPLQGMHHAAPVIAVAATSTPSTPYVVASKKVNFRSGPGTNYAAAGTAAVGKQYQVTGRNKDGTWLEICCVNGKAAWVFRSLVTLNGSISSIPLAKSTPPPPVAKPAAARLPPSRAALNGFSSRIQQPTSPAGKITTGGSTSGRRDAAASPGKMLNPPTTAAIATAAG